MCTISKNYCMNEEKEHVYQTRHTSVIIHVKKTNMFIVLHYQHFITFYSITGILLHYGMLTEFHYVI